MAFLDRSQIVRTADRAPSARGKELLAGILLAALIATARHPEPGAGGRAGARDRHAAVCGWRGGGRTRLALSGRPIPHHVARPRRKPDFHRRRHLRSDRARSDDQAFRRSRINLNKGTSFPQSDCVFYLRVQARAPLAVQANRDVGLDLERSGPHAGIFLLAIPDSPVPGRDDRSGARRRQRDRYRPCRRRPSRGSAQEGDPDRHPGRHGPAHRLCQRHGSIAADHRATARRRHSAALGMLEDVARVAGVACASSEVSESVGRKHDRCRQHRRSPKNAWPGDMADHARRRLDVARQRAGGRGRCARASDHSDIRSWHFPLR